MELNNDQEAAEIIQKKYPKVLSSPPIIQQSKESGITLSEVSLDNELFNRYYLGKAICHSPTSGPLREYYNGLIAMTRDHRFRQFNVKTKVYEQMSKTLRLLYFDTLKVKFATVHRDLIEKGYNSPRGKRIKKADVGTMSRSQAVSYATGVTAFLMPDKQTKETATDDFVTWQVGLFYGILQLDAAILSDKWLPYEELSVFPGRASPR